MKRMEKDRITKRFLHRLHCYRLVGMLWKRSIDTMMDYLRKRGLDVRQATRMALDRNEWRGFLMGTTWGIGQGMNP